MKHYDEFEEYINAFEMLTKSEVIAIIIPEKGDTRISTNRSQEEMLKLFESLVETYKSKIVYEED